MQATLSRSRVAAAPMRTRSSVSRRTSVTVKAAADPFLVVSASTAAMLVVGRFAFLPFQRRTQTNSQSVGPKTTGTTYFDSLQQDASFITSTNDPEGFTLIDTLAWGALGHALAFAFLGAASSGTVPGVTL